MEPRFWSLRGRINRPVNPAGNWSSLDHLYHMAGLSSLGKSCSPDLLVVMSGRHNVWLQVICAREYSSPAELRIQGSSRKHRARSRVPTPFRCLALKSTGKDVVDGAGSSLVTDFIMLGIHEELEKATVRGVTA